MPLYGFAGRGLFVLLLLLEGVVVVAGVLDAAPLPVYDKGKGDGARPNELGLCDRKEEYWWLRLGESVPAPAHGRL